MESSRSGRPLQTKPAKEQRPLSTESPRTRRPPSTVPAKEVIKINVASINDVIKDKTASTNKAGEAKVAPINGIIKDKAASKDGADEAKTTSNNGTAAGKPFEASLPPPNFDRNRQPTETSSDLIKSRRTVPKTLIIGDCNIKAFKVNDAGPSHYFQTVETNKFEDLLHCLSQLPPFKSYLVSYSFFVNYSDELFQLVKTVTAKNCLAKISITDPIYFRNEDCKLMFHRLCNRLKLEVLALGELVAIGKVPPYSNRNVLNSKGRLILRSVILNQLKCSPSFIRQTPSSQSSAKYMYNSAPPPVLQYPPVQSHPKPASSMTVSPLPPLVSLGPLLPTPLPRPTSQHHNWPNKPFTTSQPHILPRCPLCNQRPNPSLEAVPLPSSHTVLGPTQHSHSDNSDLSHGVPTHTNTFHIKHPNHPYSPYQSAPTTPVLPSSKPTPSFSYYIPFPPPSLHRHTSAPPQHAIEISKPTMSAPLHFQHPSHITRENLPNNDFLNTAHPHSSLIQHFPAPAGASHRAPTPPHHRPHHPPQSSHPATALASYPNPPLSAPYSRHHPPPLILAQGQTNHNVTKTPSLHLPAHISLQNPAPSLSKTSSQLGNLPSPHFCPKPLTSAQSLTNYNVIKTPPLLPPANISFQKPASSKNGHVLYKQNAKQHKPIHNNVKQMTNDFLNNIQTSITQERLQEHHEDNYANNALVANNAPVNRTGRPVEKGTEKLMNSQQHVPIQNNIDKILKELKLQIIKTSGDGHCLLYSVADSLKEQSGPNEHSLESIKLKALNETHNNMNRYQSFTRYCPGSDELLIDVEKYFHNKVYNTNFGDIVPNILSNALKTHITILNESSSGNVSKIEIAPTNLTKNEKAHHSIFVTRNNDHYSGLAPIIDQNAATERSIRLETNVECYNRYLPLGNDTDTCIFDDEAPPNSIIDSTKASGNQSEKR